jgi:type II secretory pathway pseudopilin PulG
MFNLIVYLENLIRICLVVVLLLLISISLQAQTHFAKLEKNRNIQAKDLVHQLNDTRDTLILKSTKK